MRTTIEEKRISAVFGCGDYQNIIKRLCMVAALTSDAEAKALFYQMAVRLLEEITAKGYSIFINSIQSIYKL